ncbi:hypothetical protein FKP32DRAFT_1559905 [Trametes sanguinea]|nr:hypothetical protein FKP32DRAFT_1559905 [Trametes sanguinea]
MHRLYCRGLSRPSRVSILRRALSSTAQPPRHKFVVFAPDMTDDGAFQRRLSVREQHLNDARRNASTGVIKLAGAMLTPESIESPTAEKKMVGSVFICEAESLQHVRELFTRDVYYTSGVWDQDKLVIRPLAVAINNF